MVDYQHYQHYYEHMMIKILLVSIISLSGCQVVRLAYKGYKTQAAWLGRKYQRKLQKTLKQDNQ